MTGLSLRMPVVILHLNLPMAMAVGTGNACITFNCLLCPNIKIDINVQTHWPTASINMRSGSSTIYLSGMDHMRLWRYRGSRLDSPSNASR